MMNSLSTTWSWEPGVIIFLLALVALYLLGLWRAGSRPNERPIGALRIVSFFSGVLLAALLLLSPINTIGRTQLFSVHMAQAVTLTTLCAPLILAGCPEALVRPLTRIPVVREIVRFLTFPVVASVYFNVAFLLWHTPKLYDEAIASSDVYATMMLMIFAGSLLNWWPLIGSVKELSKMSYPLQAIYAFFDGQPVDIFAFILVYSTTSLYTGIRLPAGVNFAAFGDQATGGALLLIPGLVDLGVMTPFFLRWIGQMEERTRQADLRRQQDLEVMEDEEDDEVDVEQHQQA